MPKEEDVLTTIRWMEWYRQMSWPVPTWVYHLYLAYYHFESGSEGEEAQVSEQALSNTDSGDDDACDDVPMHEFHEEEEAERLQECDPEYGHASFDYEEEANIDYEDEADPNLECEAEADCEEEANIDHEEEAELSFEDESSDEHPKAKPSRAISGTSSHPSEAEVEEPSELATALEGRVFGSKTPHSDGAPPLGNGGGITSTGGESQQMPWNRLTCECLCRCLARCANRWRCDECGNRCCSLCTFQTDSHRTYCHWCRHPLECLSLIHI